MTIALSTSDRNRSAVATSSVTIASVCRLEWASICDSAPSIPSTAAIETIASRYSQSQSVALARVTWGLSAAMAASPRTSQPAAISASTMASGAG